MAMLKATVMKEIYTEREALEPTKLIGRLLESLQHKIIRKWSSIFFSPFVPFENTMLAGFSTNTEAAYVSANHIPNHKMQRFCTMQVRKSTPLKQVCSMNKTFLTIKSLDQTQVQLHHPFTLLLDHPIENYLLCKERKHVV